MHSRSGARILAVLGTVGLTVAGLSGPTQAVPSTSAVGAAAVTCGNAAWPHPNQDTGSGKTTARASVHTGPYQACSITAYLPKGESVTYDCYAENDYGNTWTYVRSPQGASIGWVYDAYLDDGGATKLCPRI
ncbi:SH3 domain-containing protein [Micromonospora sp. CPCC 205561]|uniref:SH3 domain-containing protein n=1 Tax=Micromonospora sp. CPCC 205561 TaxID=3122407 RepID=UPI002FEE7F66